MPPARSASAAPRRQPRSAAQPAARRRPRLIVHPPKLRVRWERLGRVGLLVVLAIVVALYVEHTLSYFATRSEARQQNAIVSRLSRENAQLARQVKSLNRPATITTDARALGMVRPNERPYAIMGTSAP